jgi:two-component system, NtrC family, response regulator AtoC
MPEGGDVLTKKRSVPARGCWLLVFWEGGSRAHELRAESRLVLGRADDCDVCVPHESVSRRHAILSGSGGAWSIEDLGSSNGTFVGGVRLAKGAARSAAPGSVVMLGDARLVLDDRTKRPREDEPADAGTLDEPMHRAMRLVELVADSVLPILLLGETGVGKGRMAEAIHAGSSRSSGPFLRLNCAAVPEALLESELFGHVRGAFTGAVGDTPGLIESANLGTVFLDEIGEVPRPMQAKLLHVLEHNGVTRVGAVKPRPVDVRFVAATNRDLEALMAQGLFRRDLYFRLAGVPIRIPSLSERLDEIPGMARAFVAEACARPPRVAPEISRAAMTHLVAHRWPGNIRELRNVVMRAALLCAGPVILPEHLMLDADAPVLDAPAPPDGGAGARSPDEGAGGRLEHDRRRFERERIAEALERFAGHQGKAAEYLGVSRRTLTNKLTELGLPRPRKGKKDGGG